jgi:hypothetical protein
MESNSNLNSSIKRQQSVCYFTAFLEVFATYENALDVAIEPMPEDGELLFIRETTSQVFLRLSWDR